MRNITIWVRVNYKHQIACIKVISMHAHADRQIDRHIMVDVMHAPGSPLTYTVIIRPGYS